MRPYIRQLIEIASAVARYSQDARIWEALLLQVERVGRLMWREADATAWHPHQSDVFKIVAHDIFLSVIAVALDEDRFDLVAAAFARPWLLRETNGASRASTTDFMAFRQHVASLEQRNQRLALRRISLHADILHEAHKEGSVPSFTSLMQADFVCFLRAAIQSDDKRWYPLSLIYAVNRYSPFPLFARSESKAYFEKLAPVLGVSDLADFKQQLTKVVADERVSRLFDYHSPPVTHLANADFLGSRA